MVAKKYPTIWFQLNYVVNNTDELSKFSKDYPPKDYAWAFHATFKNIKAKHCHNILSLHKAKKISDDNIIDNGRIVSASHLEFDLNEIDLANVLDFYNFDVPCLIESHFKHACAL